MKLCGICALRAPLLLPTLRGWGHNEGQWLCPRHWKSYVESLDAEKEREQRQREHLRATYATDPKLSENPSCGGCGTIYNRTAVVKQLRDKSPGIFSEPSWITDFRCVKCGATVAIAGEGAK